MEDEEDRKRMSAAARESVKLYDVENVFPKWINLIKNLTYGH